MSRLQAAVFQVLEGFTLSDDVRKILEAAYYADDTFSQGRAAGLEEAAKEEQSALIEKLQEALAFWLPSMPMRMGMEEMASRIEHDSWLLVGAKGEIEPGAEDSGWIIKLDASHPPVGYVHLVPDDLSDNYDVRFWEKVCIGTKLYAYPPGYWSDDQMIRFAAMVLSQGNKPESIATRLQQFRLNEKECGNITPPVSYQKTESPTSSDAGKDDGKWYLQDTRSYVGNDVLWWAKDGKGYTTDVSKAHVYERDAAFRQAAMRGTDRAWPKAYIDGKTRPAVDMQYINHDEALSSLEVIGKGEKG